MQEIQLKYGNSRVSAKLPQARLLTPVLPATVPNPTALIRHALDHPLGCPPLEQLVQPGEQVVIVTSDITRYTGSALYLPLLVERLSAAGIADDDLAIVVALGIHRAQSAAEHRKILGPLYGRIQVFDHDCDNSGQLVGLGITPSGLPVAINRRVVEADRVILTGTAGFHYFAGFGGGRKGLVPGVASRETCMATHFAIFNPPEMGGRQPRAVAGVLAGNPVHEAILAAARMVQPDFLFNTVLGPDKEILGAYAGDLEQAHLAACAQVRQLYSIPLQRPADLALISCGGHPKDINFIQAHKALDYGARALRPGGTAILLAACPDGFGNPHFFDWFRHQDLTEFEAALRADYQINGQTAFATLSKARAFRVILVSGLSTEQTRAMGMEKAADLAAALDLARAGLPPHPEIVVIPDGGTILPEVTTAAKIP